MNRLPHLLLILLLLTCSSAHAEEIIRVSPSGDDRHSGRTGTAAENGPVRTIPRALALAAEALRLHPAGGVVVELESGIYRLDAGIRFGAECSGTKEAPFVLRSAPAARASILGSRPVNGFQIVEDPAIRSRLAAEGRTQILVTDLRRQGISEYGAITPRSSPGLELFAGGERMMLARWPNAGWLKVADVPQYGDTLYNQGLEREKRFDGVPAGRHYGRITYSGDRPSRWAPDPNIIAHGYWTFDWSDAYQPVAAINPDAHEITLATPHHGYGYTRNQRFAFVNLLEELDSPGEWYLDRTRGLLYFWPPSPAALAAASVSVCTDPLFSIDSASHVRIEQIDFAESRVGALRIQGSADVRVSGCTMRTLGGGAVLVDGGKGVTIESCDMSDLALGAILLRGGDRLTLDPGGHAALNNHIHDYSSWVRTGEYAVRLEGVGHRMAHNKIHDAPFEAIYVLGNDHLIEYNDVSRVTQETGDAGALHTGRNWTWQGNVVRYNYFHDLQGPGLHGVMGVYLDDWSCGWTVFGNIFYRAGRATLSGGGRDNRVENNIYIECSPSIHLDARGLGWAGYYFDGSRPELFRQMQDVGYNRPPYSTRYPHLLRMYDGETQVPKGTVVRKNISWGGRWMDIYDFHAFNPAVFDIRDNVIADEGLLRRWKAGQQGWDPYYIDIDMKEGYELLGPADSTARSFFAGNLLRNAPGKGFDPATGRLSLPSSMIPPGFARIPQEKIGLQPDRFRKTTP